MKRLFLLPALLCIWSPSRAVDIAISALPSLSGASVDYAADVLPIVDISAGTTNKITVGSLLTLYAGTTNVTTLGTVTTGTWNATPIALARLAANSVDSSKIVDLSIVGGDLADNTISNAKLALIATNVIKGRVTAAAGNLEDLTPAQALTVLESGGSNILLATEIDTSTKLQNIISGEIGTGPLMFTRTGVRRTIYINAGAMIPRATAGAAPGTVELPANKTMFDCMDFDTATEENVGFWVTLPGTWDLTALTAKFHWTAASGTGTVKWDIAAKCCIDGVNIDTTALGTEATSGADTMLGANIMHVTATTGALTPAATLSANRPIYFQVSRDTATDTLGVDARLLGVTIEYQESPAEPAPQ
jgi:hypothetical protein